MQIWFFILLFYLLSHNKITTSFLKEGLLLGNLIYYRLHALKYWAGDKSSVLPSYKQVTRLQFTKLAFSLVLLNCKMDYKLLFFKKHNSLTQYKFNSTPNLDQIQLQSEIYLYYIIMTEILKVWSDCTCFLLTIFWYFVILLNYPYIYFT